MIMSIIDDVDPPLEISLIKSNLDFVWTLVVINKVVCPLTSVFGMLASVSYLLSMTRA